METKYGIGIIVGMCVLIIFLGGVKKKSEYILNFLVRVVVGLVCIYFANEFLNGLPYGQILISNNDKPVDATRPAE